MVTFSPIISSWVNVRGGLKIESNFECLFFPVKAKLEGIRQMSAVLSAVLKCFPSNMKKKFSDPSLNFNFENAENETPNQRVTVRTDEELNKGGEGEEKNRHKHKPVYTICMYVQGLMVAN